MKRVFDNVPALVKAIKDETSLLTVADAAQMAEPVTKTGGHPGDSAHTAHTSSKSAPPAAKAEAEGPEEDGSRGRGRRWWEEGAGSVPDWMVSHQGDPTARTGKVALVFGREDDGFYPVRNHLMLYQ